MADTSRHGSDRHNYTDLMSADKDNASYKSPKVHKEYKLLDSRSQSKVSKSPSTKYTANTSLDEKFLTRPSSFDFCEKSSRVTEKPYASSFGSTQSGSSNRKMDKSSVEKNIKGNQSMDDRLMLKQHLSSSLNQYSSLGNGYGENSFSSSRKVRDVSAIEIII